MRKRPTVYIAGQMSSKRDNNIRAFNKREAEMSKLGYKSINPPKLDIKDPPDSWASAMKRDIPLLILCDRITMVPGWSASRGASFEALIAKVLGIKEIGSTGRTINRCLWALISIFSKNFVGRD